MKTVVLTGPVCGGKSLLANLLAARGGEVVDADHLAHRLLEEPDVRRDLAAAFGPGVLVAGRIDRGRLGERVFADPAALAELNRIIHPLLAVRLDARLSELALRIGPALAVVEAAVYFLLPTTFDAELVVTVTAPRGIRVRRLMERNGLDEAAALARIQAQEPLEEAWARADLVLVNNDGPEILTQAADDIIARLATAGPADPHTDP